VCEDFHRGVFNLISHKLPNIRLFRNLRTEDTQEAHEIALVHYSLRKQLQIVITSSCYFFWILVHFYWNSQFFGDIVTNQTDFERMCYLIPITLLVDVVCGFITYGIASKIYNYDMLNLMERYYRYPKVRSFSILMTIAAFQILFITTFEVKVISS